MCLEGNLTPFIFGGRLVERATASRVAGVGESPGETIGEGSRERSIGRRNDGSGGELTLASSCRIVDLDFDVAASAGWYSATAGVLAGFALLAILLPLDHETAAAADDPHATDGVVILVCAFFSLLILGFTYAVLAGRTASSAHGAAVAAHEQLLNGVAFGLTALLLLFALRAILATYGTNRQVFRPAEQIILGATAVFGPVVLLSLQFANAVDLERLRIDPNTTSSCGPGGVPSGIWLNLVVTVLAFIGIGVLALIRRRLPRRNSAPIWIAKAVLVFTVALVAWTSVAVPLLPTVVVGGAAAEHLVLGLTAIATLAVAAASWAAR